MPKASPNQTSFAAGEFSPKAQGRVDSERYKTGLDTDINYIPTIQGPLVRRPGMKYVANAKDPSKPPAFLEFEYTKNQNYILEFGDQYIRFFTGEGQVTTTSTHFKLSGMAGFNNSTFGSSVWYAMRNQPFVARAETILSSSQINASSIMEIGSPYTWPDVHNLKFEQVDDVIFIVHSSYMRYALQRLAPQLWEMRPQFETDGPYLAPNSYRTSGDNARTQIAAEYNPPVIFADSSVIYGMSTYPILAVSSVVSAGFMGWAQVMCQTAHGMFNGDKVFVDSVVLTNSTVINNSNSSFWTVYKITDYVLYLANTVFNSGTVYVSGGQIRPALLDASENQNDYNRLMSFTRKDGGRAWGKIVSVVNAATFLVHVEKILSPLVSGSSAALNVNQFWQLGAYSKGTGYPSAITLHQDRLILSGVPAFPLRLDGSTTGDYNNFAPAGSSNVVADNNAFSFTLRSSMNNGLNPICWIKSDTNGLLAGAAKSEWKITESNQAAAMTPTNIDAKETSFYGSHVSNAIQTGNATLYIQGGQRRLRELNYFFQVNTYRSTDLTEVSDHIAGPGMTKLAVQKETLPLIWGLRTDGILISMSYSRDDAGIKAGWARHYLGGQSDSGGSAPTIKSFGCITASSGTYDQLWCAVQRYINGTSVVTVEFMKRPYDDQMKQEDSFYFDCGGTYDNPIIITGISTGSAQVTAASHGFSNNDLVRIDEVIGMNSSLIDINGYVFNSNLVNGRVFTVASSLANSFLLKDSDGVNVVDSRSYSPYVSGGAARKLVSTISGLTWLKNETVSILADGGPHPTAVVNSAGVVALQYPAAKVQIGYDYNSDGKTLRPEAGSADGSSIGKYRRTYRAAFMLYQAGVFYTGPSFTKLTPIEFLNADTGAADTAATLQSGVFRESMETEYDFEGQLCFRQNGGLPGMVQSITKMLEEQDV